MSAAPLVLAIDQGTTNTKAVLVDASGRINARASAPLTTSYPNPGWAEQSAEAIWDSVRKVIAELAPQAGGVVAISLANQRETLVLWDAETGKPVAPAIIWQCRRSAADCARLHAEGHDTRVVELTGLGINPLFPASKLGWAMRNIPGVADLAAQDRLRAGTVDAWLLWNLTGGASFLTDHSNASRTQLFDTDKLEWSAELCELFGAPIGALPRPVASDAEFGLTADGATALPAGIAIRAMMGDSHAALYGHGVRAPGPVKATFGTGSSLMTLTPQRTASRHGLSGTIAWSDRNGTAHALEGNITVSAQAAAFMAGLLGTGNAQALSDLAQTVESAEGVAFVPALAGLGAPHWDDKATGLVTGMTHGTKPAHLAHATFEAIAQQIADVFAAMELDVGHPLADLRADGGASGNAFLMQLQADLLDRPVLRAEVEEVGALGAAAMAFAALGHPAQVAEESTTRFAPNMAPATRENLRDVWAKAIARARA
ncbi:FGGY-family carbohydrate kinase [Paracoccus aestuariivivens]|uniref:FGGY-family carbohydrate kinase n=1 Tax=Paracoccus aestuariivivens TaxID=1820333 RepID=UPI0031B65062